MTSSLDLIDQKEEIARVLHREWVVDEKLQLNAFALRSGESYLSVNRLAVESFSCDIHDFVSHHPDYLISAESCMCHLAVIRVHDIHDQSISYKEWIASLTVEVEPRSTHYKSHAGIFTRVNGRNLKGGQQAELLANDGKKVSYDEIQLKVQLNLVRIAQLSTCELSLLQETE